MSKQDIIDRILSDATSEADKIIADAKATAEKIIAEATLNAEAERLASKKIAEDRAKAILEGKRASARLDGAKILLAKKREVLDEVYEKAAKQLNKMSAHDCLLTTERLLKSYAEEGDEIVFADGFPCVREVSALPVIKDKKLKVTFGGTDISGGFLLIGKTSDKDLSTTAILNADRAENEAEIAAELFK
jgi:V/A-type H+-transporting ATPase subunit E